jgi:hypothetical protein
MKSNKKSPGTQKRRSRRVSKRPSAPRTAKEYFESPPRVQDRWDRVVSVISKMRTDGSSLQRASREFGITPETVRRWAGSALRKQANGRYAAGPSDRLLRILKIPDAKGTLDIAVPGSRQATLLSKY